MMKADEELARRDFVARLTECVERLGSVYALGKKTGIPANTIRLYLRGSEPSRTKLVALARAADVSVAWLACGEPMSPQLQGPPQKPDRPSIQEIHRALRELTTTQKLKIMELLLRDVTRSLPG